MANLFTKVTEQQVGSVGFSNKTLLQPSDLAYLGIILYPPDDTVAYGNSWGGLAGRVVGADTRLFVTGHATTSNPTPGAVSELIVPSSTGTTLSNAPRMSVYRSWGDIYKGKRLTTGGEPVTRGLLWHDSRLWWAYGHIYNTGGNHDPSIGCTVLDNSTGTKTAYGPWRTSEHSQRTRGYMLELPTTWANANTSGQRIAVGAPTTSGNAYVPWGAALSTFTTPDISTPADVVGSTAYALGSKNLILHTINTPQQRPNNNWKRCGWADYPILTNPFTQEGTYDFQDYDTMSASVYIDTPTKYGVILFGQLIDILDGFNYGAGETLPHMWYGPNICGHGQNGEPLWQATGPGCPTSVAYAWFYNPTDLAEVWSGLRAPSSVVASNAVRIRSQWPSADLVYGQCPPYPFGGAWFDSTTSLLYVSQTQTDTITNHYEPRPILHVWSVS